MTDADRSATLDRLAARRASLSSESRELVRYLAEQIDARVRLRLTRKTLGLTQSEAALIAGVTQADISRIESGETSPTVDRMSRIMRRLGEWAEGG
jgi:DNA-binding XRE family transcriptional regulator